MIVRCTYAFRQALLGIMMSAMIVSLCTAQTPGRSRSPLPRAPRVHPPDWFTNIPPDENRIVARGRGESRDEQVAVDKAVAAARSSLADSVNSGWMDLVRAIRREVPDTTSAVGGPVTLAGSAMTSQKTVRRGDMWYAFVLVALPQQSVRAAVLERLYRDGQWYAKVKDTRAVSTYEQGHR